MTDELARFKKGQGWHKVASFPPFSKNGPPVPPSGPAKRNIPKDHEFDPQALKPMSQALWATSVALGHALTAYRQLNRLKSTSVSPDGMLGGRGYVMGVKEAREKLYNACEALSAISDTLYDEIRGPHWKPKLAQLDENDAEDVSRFVEESQDILGDPEADAEEDMKAIAEENDDKPPKKKKEEAPAAPTGSAMPKGGPQEESEARPPSPGSREKEAGELRGRMFFAAIFDEASTWDTTNTTANSIETPPPASKPSLAERIVARTKQANSSLPVDTLPGPRVNHLDRGEAQGPWGSYNDEEKPQADDYWQADEGVGDDYAYTSEWENDFRREAESLTPTDDTPAEGWDFGIGYGARGEGAGGYENPSDEGRGVWGPQSGLPGAPAGASGDNTPVIDVSLNDRKALLNSLLPGDTAAPVARSDYYPGQKDNLVQGQRAESELPGEASPWHEEEYSMVNTLTYNEDLETPYVRYDYTTPSFRDDPLHNWPQEERLNHG